MIFSSSGLDFLLLIFYALYVGQALPTITQPGGTSCTACVQSYSCDPRCAPVVFNASPITSGGTVQRWCTSTSSNSNSQCCCGCTTVNDASTNNQPSYFWFDYDNLTCSNQCPPGFYPPANSGYSCLPCDSWCQTCTGSGPNDCLTCSAIAYTVNSTACYAYATPQHSALTTKLNPCPDGYYGVQITKICVPCNTGCAICAIELTWEMPNAANFATTYDQDGKNCTGLGDPLCGYTLKCYQCKTGYTLINGICIANTKCFVYSKYSSSATGSFSSANCYCFTGFRLVGPGFCSKCNINCKTCSGSASNQCTSCPTGASTTSCVYNSTYDELLNWGSSIPSINTGGEWTTNVGSAPIAGVDQGLCQSSNYVFGYYGYYNEHVYSTTLGLTYGTNMFPSGAKLTYTNNAAFSSTDHYAVHFRATLLFIDDWTNGMSILFTEGGYNRFQFDYQMEGVPGQYLCGYRTHDHLDLVDFTFSHNLSSLVLNIYATVNGKAWGIKEVIIHALTCDSSCSSCSGPTIKDCLTCADSSQIVVDGDCVCDSANGYFLKNGSCVTHCGSMIQNQLLYSCVDSCSFPNYFIATYSNGTRYCTVNCPTNQYKMVSLTNSSMMTCVDDCYDTNETNITLNQFKFDGLEKVCFNECPYGTFGDPVSHSCVRTCPAYNNNSNISVDGYFSYGYYCYETCPTGWAYVPQRACLSSCPSGYYKNYLMKNSTNSTICEQQCSVTLQGQYHYGDNATGNCTDYCSTGTYGDSQTHLCLSLCNSTAFAQEITLSGGIVERLCVINCSYSDGIYGNPESGFCVIPTDCPDNYYADPLTFQCTRRCSGDDYFGDNSTQECTNATCANAAFKQNDTKICVQTCLNNNSLLSPEWGDTVTGYCVETCDENYFGDPQQNMKCVQTCAASPSSTFGLDHLCVVNCSNQTWADPYHINRICTTSCSSDTADSYGYNTTRTCVLYCPDGQFAHNVSGIPLCVYGCTDDSGQFGDIQSNRCKDQCPAPYYGDVTGNRTCVLRCPQPYYAANCTMNGSTIIESGDRVCVTDCSGCGWADNSSQTCAWTSEGCQNFTYAHENNHKCVVETECDGFADPVSRYCISPCLKTASVIYFGDPSTKLCVLICPQVPDYYGDNGTQTCNLSCSSDYVRDPQYLRRCVNSTDCSRTPLVLFGDPVKRLCVVALNCTDGYYGDNNTNQCRSICPGPSSLLYADNVTKQCVDQCGLGWFALNITVNATTTQGICSEFCPSGQWADNLTVQCTTRCSNLTYGTNYTGNWSSSGYNYTSYGVCETQCREGQFARDEDNLCVQNCGDNNASALWGDSLTKTCKTSPFSCPDGYYADNYTHMCVLPLNCSEVNGVQYVADNLTRTCVPKCPSTEHNFADMNKFLCVQKCPTGFYGFNDTLRCEQECKYANNSYEGSYADPQLNICVKICSSSPSPLFGENVTFTCVEARYCPTYTWAEVIVYNRQCVPVCPPPNTNSKGNAQMYADNLTFSCVEQCPTYSFADLSTGEGICVYVCPKLSNGTIQFADNSTKTCVLVCPSAESTFGDPDTVSCVVTCPLGSYAQEFPYRYCVQKCADHSWGEDIKRTCVTSPLMCPTVNGTIYYADNISTMCVKKCPGPTNSTAGSWGQNTTRACLTTCLLPGGIQSGFKWNLTRVCIDICPAEIGRDGSYSDQGMCYYVCMTNNTYRDPQYNRSCQTDCSFSPIKQYADDTTWRCLSKCPSYPQHYYADDNLKKCVNQCSLSYRKLESTMVCVAVCPIGTFFNNETYHCLESCPTETQNGYRLFGDTTQNQSICVNATDCPSGYYADENVGLCVANCSQNQWIHGKYCLYQCPDGYYGNYQTLRCVIPEDCPTNYYADNQTVTCVSVCPGSFADFFNQTCVFVCPIVNQTIYYADPVTRVCNTSCTFTDKIELIKNDKDQTCVSQCQAEMFFDPFTYSCSKVCSNGYYSDNSTRVCVSVCPATPPLFGQNDTYTCVEECLNVSEFRYIQARVCVYPCPSGFYMQNITRNCVSYCPNMTYADSVSGYCVSNCSTQYSYDETHTCQSSCPSPYFKDDTTYKCVFDCPQSPQTYFQVVDGGDRFCNTSCPSGQYRDFTSFTCVSHCELYPITFADDTSGSCLAVCSSGYYGYLTDRTCESTCPSSMFADPNTRMCVEQCDPDLGFFGDSYLVIPACVAVCSSGYYANPYTQTCVDICPSYPMKMYSFDNGDSGDPVRQCVYSCPYPYVADNKTGQCHAQCSHSEYPYLDKALKSCVSQCSSPIYQYAYMPTGQTVDGECVKFCPTVGGVHFYALLTDNTCVKKCPNGLYGNKVNNTCNQFCNEADNLYADPQINLCVETCTHNDSFFSYANEFTRTCVTDCPTQYGLVGDRTIWKCVRRCSNLSEYADLEDGYCVSKCPSTYFADNTTQTCIKNCSLYTLMYGDTANRICVVQCPLNTLFSDNSKRLCVNATDCSTGLFGYNATRECIEVCPAVPDLFGNPETQTCQYSCPNSTTAYYADPVSRLCVQKCPEVPAYFAQNTTLRCVMFCPPDSYADNHTRYCIKTCSIVEEQTFADNTTNLCVKVCPIEPNYYASNHTWECVINCPSSPSMYADNSTRSCVYYCPGDDINTYADDSTRSCVEVCPDLTYNENSTRQCLDRCLTGFADNSSKYCIQRCPHYTYGDNDTDRCVDVCPVVDSKQTYAEDGNSLCMLQCLSFYKSYADPYSKKCVKICPISQNYFANPNDRTCTDICPQFPVKMYADFSTRFCVYKCPKIPSLFGIISSRVCTSICPNETWADNISRTCLPICVTTPESFGDNSTWTCVTLCPTEPDYYADSTSHFCVPKCPAPYDLYADNITRKCVDHCPNYTYADPVSRRCVTTCPQGYYGVNSTWRCETKCPWRQFADELMNLCVKKCSVDPIYYGNPDNLHCVTECPQVNNSFGNPLTQQCVNFQLDGTSGCPVTYFADNVSRLCVQVCPMTNDTYADSSTWKCVDQCPGGSVNTFSDNSTMRCVKTCPSYPDYYAETVSRRCVFDCLTPNSSFTGSFSDNSTRKCVTKCPYSPDYYSDNSTGRCVFYCPHQPLTFADNQTRRCVTTCPSIPDIYGDLSTLRCVEKCPVIDQTFADNNTRRCVKVCPNNTIPPLYAENASQRCVPTCPNNSYADNHTQKCVAVCPRYPEYYGDPSTHKCVKRCPSNPDYFADPISQKCVPLCEEGYYAQNYTRRCLSQCLWNYTNYADNETRRCVKKCPMSKLTWGDNQTQQCVHKCPETPTTYADNVTQTCVLICYNVSNGGYADNYSRVCVSKCPDGSYADITTRYCVRYCPLDWYGLEGDNLCVQHCPTPLFADNTTWMCVEQCPRVQTMYGEAINNTCVMVCPNGTYSSDENQQCVSRCPNYTETVLGHDTFGLNSTHDCVEQCPYPLLGYPASQVCVDICPDPYYPNVTDHRCYKCPNPCANCTNPYNCLTCNLGYYLYSGACVQSCPTFPVITYANPNRICGTALNCTQGYYALNATKSCVSSCPAGYYVNIQAQTCDSCMKGCVNCKTLSTCLACNIYTAIWSDYVCYTYCSPLKRYYTLKGCVSYCPEGTYLSLTTCQNCSSVCKSCIITAQNCLICANGYYRSSGICVSQCPSGTVAQIVNGSQTCVTCTASKCKQQPLTFTTTQFVDNFQYQVQIKFNQPVDIKKQIDKVIQIQQVTRSRLLVTSFSYLNYTIYDYGDGLYVFILNNYNPSSGSAIQVQILDPSAIQTASGQMPQTTRVEFSVDTSNIYSLDSYNQGIPNYLLFVAIVAFIMLLLTFGSHQSIWMPMYDFMQLVVCCAFINVTYPPNLLYSIKSSLISAFTFLPNFFGNSFTKAMYDKDYNNNNIYSLMQDAAFLRILGSLYFIVVMLIVILIFIGILSKKSPTKEIKKWAKHFLRELFWKKHVHGLIYILFLPVFLLGIYDMSIYNYLGSSFIQIFSIISSFLFMITFLIVVIYFAYKMRKIVKEYPIAYLMIQKAYNFILYQKTVLVENQNHYFTHEKNQFDLTDARQPKVNELPIFPYPIETKTGSWQIAFPLISYLHKFLTAAFLAISFNNPVIALILLILINLAFLVYMILKKPFFTVRTREYNNQMYIHNTIVIILVDLVLLIFVFVYSQLDQDSKVLIGNVICAILIEGFTVNAIYFFFRLYHYYHHYLWKAFVRSDFFRVNYIVEHLEWTKSYEKEQQKLMSEVKPRSQFLEAITIQTGEALANMVIRAPSVSGSTKEKMKALKLRPNKAQVAAQEYGQIFTNIANQKQRSNKSAVSSQRLSKNDRKKIRDTIFGQKHLEEKDVGAYTKLELIDEKNEEEGSHKESVQEENEETEYEFEYIEEEYPEGTPMEQIMEGCKKGDVILH